MTLIKFDKEKDVISKHFPLFERIAGKNDYNNFVLSGGRSSFKSYDISLAILIDIIVHASKGQTANALVFMNKAEDLREGAFQLFKNIIDDLGMDRDFKIRQKPMTIFYKNGSQITFYGLNMQDAKKGNAIQNIAWAWYEECDQIQAPDVIKATQDTILRNNIKGEYIKTVYSYNPPKSAHHWINEFVKNIKGKKIHTTYLDDDTGKNILSKQQLEEIQNTKETDYSWYVWNYLGITPDSADVDFPGPINPTKELELTDKDYVFAGIDSSTRGEDSTIVCLIAYNIVNKSIKLLGFQNFDDIWIDGYTSYKVGSDIATLLNSVNTNAVDIDPEKGQHIIDHLSLYEPQIQTNSTNFGSKVSENAKGKTALAYNKRAEMYLNASAELKSKNVFNYCDVTELMRQLDATELEMKEKKIKLIDKKIIKARIGKSPDEADSFVLAIQALYDFMKI